MIVKELIEQLSKTDPYKEVFVSYYDEDGEDIVKIDNDRNAVFLVYGDSNIEAYEEPYDDMGFNPYMGCYDYDC